MEDFDLKQERRYCGRLGFAMLFVLLWTLVWQYKKIGPVSQQTINILKKTKLNSKKTNLF